MQHPLVLILPVMMLLDYFLTVVGARLAETEYRRHFKFPDYETNPAFRDVIRRKKWISLKHLAAVAIATGFCVYWARIWQSDDVWSQTLFGAVLILFATIIGAHIANILTFRWLNQRPDQVSGEVVMTQRYVLHLTRSRMIATLLPVAVAAWLSRSPFVIGGTSSLIALILVQSVWGWREARRERHAAAPNNGEHPIIR